MLREHLLRALCLLLLTCIGWAVDAAAQNGRNCAYHEAPLTHSGATCGGKCFVTVAGTTISCTPNTGGSHDITLYIVSDYANIGDHWYSSWGTDEHGNDFCCVIEDDDDDIDTVWVYGGAGDDFLAAAWGTLSLDHVFSIEIEGRGGEDTIVASDAVGSTLYGNAGADRLYGGALADVIEGNGGDDLIYGGGGNDTIYGGVGHDEIYGEGGADLIYGGDGNDTISGGNGDDVIYGQGGNDVLKGGNGNDTLYGGSGSDVLCGGGTSGSGADYLHASEPLMIEFPNALDILWEPSASNQPTGGGALTGDYCGSTSHTPGWAGANCAYTLSSRPSQCN